MLYPPFSQRAFDKDRTSDVGIGEKTLGIVLDVSLFRRKQAEPIRQLQLSECPTLCINHGGIERL